MKDIVITFNNGKTVHYLNAEYYYENGDIIVKEYEHYGYGGYYLTGIHHIPENEVQEIKYEG